MKKYILITGILILCSYSLSAQVGINTDSPEQEFHVDPMSNTLTSDPSTKTDDIVFTSDGSVGIGTTSPDTEEKLHVIGNVKVGGSSIIKDTLVIEGDGLTSKIGINTVSPEANLHIANTTDKSKLRISDGSEKLGNILTANESGNTYWEGLRPMSTIERGSLKADVIVNGGSKVYNATQDSLFLSPGRWLVIAKTSVMKHSNGNNLGFFYIYMDLVADKDFTGGQFEAVLNGVKIAGSGSSAETQDGSANAASPNLMCIVDIPVKPGTTIGTKEYNTALWIVLHSSAYAKTTTGYGDMQFYAIRIDRQD